MSVIVSRALPDVRDGFKPVHRRILYGMMELGNTSDKPYKKSARIVGEVLGKYHPHGDSSVYLAMVRMAQEWAMRYPLVDGQGNFGSVDGDSPAAMRYTEARLNKLGEAMMEDLYKETVDFEPNFDNTLVEPTVMPTRIPNLLVNGASGIAVGMATNMPPHNLSEVIDACDAYLDNPEITVEELMNYVKAPDFPTGGYIYGFWHSYSFTIGCSSADKREIEVVGCRTVECRYGQLVLFQRSDDYTEHEQDGFSASKYAGTYECHMFGFECLSAASLVWSRNGELYTGYGQGVESGYNTGLYNFCS